MEEMLPPKRGKAATKCLTADDTDDTDKEGKEQLKEIIREIRAIRGHKGPQIFAECEFEQYHCGGTS